jgi:aromatic-L-amino-acid decarboxylase
MRELLSSSDRAFGPSGHLTIGKQQNCIIGSLIQCSNKLFTIHDLLFTIPILKKPNHKKRRVVPLDLAPGEFRSAGHKLIDDIAGLLATIGNRGVTTAKSPSQVRAMIQSPGIPKKGTRASKLLRDTTNMLLADSLFNGHPKFWGYVTSSPAPIGILGDLLAAGINQNVGAFALSPIATEIEAQTIRWIAEMIGYPTDCGGILVSGGNMANFVGFLAARKGKATWDIRKEGLSHKGKQLRVYCSNETHTWVQKAADMYGLGTDAIAFISTDDHQRIDVRALEAQLKKDIKKGHLPFLLIGSAGTVSTGAVDPLRELAVVARKYNLWFHIDGAYGGFAGVLPDANDDLKAMREADSVAVDPHKWLYAPLEAGCALIRDPHALENTFSYHPPYYRFDDNKEESLTNYHELGPQNSRGFRALKVWLAMKQVGRSGYERMIADDVALARKLFEDVQTYPDLQLLSYGLSITTFRYAPQHAQDGSQQAEEYLNKLNTELLARLQSSGKAYPSNAVVQGKFAIRVCIVNFRTTERDIRALPKMVIEIGKKIDKEWKSNAPQRQSRAK